MTLNHSLKLQLLDKLPEETKNFIKESFFLTAQQTTQAELDYVHRKITKKLDSTKTSSTEWIRNLSSCFSLLYDIFVQKSSEMTPASSRLIGAALFYFINPYDIVPDHIPEIGHLDDLFVLITCLESLMARDKLSTEKLFAEIFAKVQALS